MTTSKKGRKEAQTTERTGQGAMRKNLTTQAEAVNERVRRELATNPLDAPLPESLNAATTDTDRERYRLSGEYYARLLWHPDTPREFVEAFECLYTDTLLYRGSIGLSDPRILRLAHAGVMEVLNDSIPADADAIMASLRRLAEKLIPAGVREPIHKAVYFSEKGGAE